MFDTGLAGRRFLAAGLMALAACGGDDNTGPEDDDGGQETTGIEVINGFTALDVWYVYIWECGDDPTGSPDLLESDVIAPGDSHLFEMDPGCYGYQIVMEDDEPVFDGETEVPEDLIRTITVSPGDDGCAPDCILEKRTKVQR